MRALLGWISVRHLVLSPVRSLLVVFGIALGVAMLVATRAVNESVHSAFVEAVGRVAGKADLVVTGGEVGVAASIVEEVASVEGVAHVAGILEITTQVAGGGPLLVLGVDFLGDKHFLPFSTQAGSNSDDPDEDPLELINDERGILVANKLAVQAGLQVGGTVALLTPDGVEDFRVRGILEDKGPAASFGGQVAVMFIEAARVSFGRGELVDRIDIALRDGAARDEVRARLDTVVGSRGHVDEPGGRARNVAGMLAPLEAGIQIAGFVALIVGMFIIYNAVGIAVAQRRREIGILRALGTTKSGIVRMFALEALVLALLGSAVGIAVAPWIARFAVNQAAPSVSQFYMRIVPPPPQVDLPLALLGIALGLTATFAAAYRPAMLAAGVDPISAMRPVRDRPLDEHVRHRGMLIAGVLCVVASIAFATVGSLWTGFIAMGLVIAGFVLAVPAFVLASGKFARVAAESALGIPGRVAIDNVTRSLERSALTVAALTVSVGSAVCVGSWARSLEVSLLEWIQETIPADLSATHGSPLPDQQNVPFRAEVLDKLAGIEGVRQVLPVRIATHEIGKVRVQVVSQPALQYFQAMAAKGLVLRVIDGKEPLDGAELAASPLVIISENAARYLDVKAGGKIHVETPTGAHELAVRAVVVDYTSTLGMVFLDRKHFVALWGDTLVDTADIYLERGADLEKVAAEVKKRLGGDDAIFVSSSADLRHEVERVVLDAVAITRSTDLVAIIVALLGVVGTMLAAVIDRVRELGLLRAIGATKRQIVLAVVAESGFLGAAAVVLGVVASIPMGAIFVHVVALAATGWRLDYHFPAAVAFQVAAAVIVTAAVAGLIPGRLAAGIGIKEALSYE